jgi:hypothetical protein
MFLSPWNLIQAILFALGVWWCKEIFSRWRDDVAKLRPPADSVDRVVVILLWSITVLALWLCVRFAVNIAETILRGIRELR